MSGGYRRIGAVAEYGHTDQYHRDREDGCDDRNYATGAHGDGYSGVYKLCGTGDSGIHSHCCRI